MLTAAQVAERLNVSRRHVYDLISQGAFPIHRFGSAVRVDEADLEAYIASCRVVVRPIPTGSFGSPQELVASDPEEWLRNFRASGGRLTGEKRGKTVKR